MDFAEMKKKAMQIKDKCVVIANETIDKTILKASESSLVLKNQQQLEEFILESQNKTFVSSDWENKVFTRRTILIIGDIKKDFFKDFIISFPVLFTKSFSQNVKMKLADFSNTEIDLSKYDLKEFPSMIVFENKEIYKIIIWEEEIKKVVKGLSLDINKTIDEI